MLSICCRATKFDESDGLSHSNGWATITNNTQSLEFRGGTVMWGLDANFSYFEEVYIWIDELGGANVVNNYKMPPSPWYLGAACARLSLLTPLGRNICEGACEIASCCWNPDVPSCLAYNLECSSGYAKCSNLVRDEVDEEDATLEDVTEACEGYEEGNEETLCGVVCEPGACCFVDGETCDSDVDCTVFVPCSVVFGNSTDSDTAEDVTVSAVRREDGPFF